MPRIFCDISVSTVEYLLYLGLPEKEARDDIPVDYPHVSEQFSKDKNWIKIRGQNHMLGMTIDGLFSEF